MEYRRNAVRHSMSVSSGLRYLRGSVEMAVDFDSSTEAARYVDGVTHG